MEVQVSPALVALATRQLEEKRRQQVLAFQDVFADYAASVQRSRELQVRNAVLEKEAGELRLDNDTIRQQLEALQHASATREEVAAAEAETARLRAELTSAYRDKGDVTRQLLEKTNQLGVVREANEHLLRDVDALATRLQESKERCAGLERAAEADRAAAALAASELQGHILEKEGFHARVLALEAEVSDLSARLVEARAGEAERMNKVNRMCDAMIANAKQLEAQAQAKLEAMTLQAAGAARAQQRTAAATAPDAGPAAPAAAGSGAQAGEGQQQLPQQQPQEQGGGGSRPSPHAARAAAVGQVAGQIAGGLRTFFARRTASTGGAAGRRGSSSEQGEHVFGETLLPPEPPPLIALNLPPPSMAGRVVHAHEGGCYGLAFDRSGHRLASCGADKTVKIWEPEHGAHVSTLQGMTETVLSVSFTADQRCVLAGGRDMRLWDVASGRQRHTLTGHNPNRVSAVACSPTEPHRAVSAANDRSIRVWDLGKGWCLRTVLVASTCTCLDVTRDGGLAASGHMDGGLRLWDLRSGKPARELLHLHAGNLTSVCAGMAGGMLLTCGKDNALRCVDTRTWEPLAELRAPGFTVGGIWCQAALSPNERYAAAGSASGALYVWPTDPAQGGAPSLTLDKQHHGRVVAAACWSPLFSPLVSADSRGGLVFWQGTGGPDA